MWSKMSPAGRAVIVSLVLGVVGFGVYHFGLFDKLAPKDKQSVASVSKSDMKEYAQKTGMDHPIRVGTVTWPGYAGFQYFNGGFKASKESRYYKEYGILVECVNNDDVPNGREQWKSGAVDVLWSTADTYSIDAVALKEFEPVVIYQADWSYGGDAVVVSRGINTVSDLANGKHTVAAAIGTPSHTLLTFLLQSAGKTFNDIKFVPVQSAIEAAAMFKTGKVDAAVVWSPDDVNCTQGADAVPGSKILLNTKLASHVISDVFFVKKAFLDSHEKELKALVEGWMKGAAEINSNPAAKKEAAKILASGFTGISPADAEAMLDNVRLTTYGDNMNFFGLNRSYTGVKGSDLYTKMAKVYETFDLTKNPPYWNSVVSTSLLNQINLAGKENEAWGTATFAKVSTEEGKAVTAFSEKRITINFNTGSSVLDDNAKTIIDLQLVESAKAFSHARIRIEGNTDNVGSETTNQVLSQKRAKAVADYLASQYGFDTNRFVVVGNGATKPVADNESSDGRSKNRRTDFELLAQ